MNPNVIKIRRATAAHESEPLRRPFGFKGAQVTELWQTAVQVESTGGQRALGLGTQSVLWSDPDVFVSHSEDRGNGLMFDVTERALDLARGVEFSDPVELMDRLLPEVLTYARQVTGRERLRRTFVLNALVALDHAAWLLFAQALGTRSFDTMIPGEYRAAFAHRHRRIACLPAIGYDTPIQEIEQAAAEGYLYFKVKLGHPGDQEEMLSRDMGRLDEIHRVLGPLSTDRTPSGTLRYCLDANGRYEDKASLRRFLDFADSIGALDRIVVFEEPFPEHCTQEVGDLGVCIAADESANTDADCRERIELGYGAIALKPVAKTLSMTLKMAKVASEHQVPCFCADLTVNPILVDWNKMVAARLAPLPGLDTGLLEANGRQLYLRWPAMERDHPRAGAAWTGVVDGTFQLDGDFYEQNGGIFDPSPHYLELLSSA